MGGLSGFSLLLPDNQVAQLEVSKRNDLRFECFKQKRDVFHRNREYDHKYRRIAQSNGHGRAERSNKQLIIILARKNEKIVMRDIFRWIMV